ncbi:uncharacterized protein C8Q71DRAFT_725890 [Rhodofomes roseus]|uniref:Uncharacterized protein n=1 Tax=Rhodofomes roseus TaxID=34475 RepID=A0ABQ8K7M1_9APHY|nr:uncharacterized protein C8Q71DRAFT_725890 [Rhodofomes roseus]KAH9833245.1 hypothetical protein C8Q71DRAFT_725890 [Rhodofomes roseus]
MADKFGTDFAFVYSFPSVIDPQVQFPQTKPAPAQLGSCDDWQNAVLQYLDGDYAVPDFIDISWVTSDIQHATWTAFYANSSLSNEEFFERANTERAPILPDPTNSANMESSCVQRWEDGDVASTPPSVPAPPPAPTVSRGLRFDPAPRISRSRQLVQTLWDRPLPGGTTVEAPPVPRHHSGGEAPGANRSILEIVQEKARRQTAKSTPATSDTHSMPATEQAQAPAPTSGSQTASLVYEFIEYEPESSQSPTTSKKRKTPTPLPEETPKAKRRKLPIYAKSSALKTFYWEARHMGGDGKLLPVK